MKKFLSVAAIVVVIYAIASWLWPSEAPSPPAPAAAIPEEHVVEEPPPPPAHEEKDRMRVAFINHLGDANIRFTVDGVYICTANAGHSCYGDIRFGKHVVEALEGKKVVRTMDFTVDTKTSNPKITVCFPTSPNC